MIKCIPHVQHEYFSSLNQSDHCFLASPLPLPSSLRKLPIINKCRQLQGSTRVQLSAAAEKDCCSTERINMRLIEEQIKKIRGNAKQLLYYVSKLM